MAEIAAILFVRAVMPELAPHDGLLFFFPVTPRWDLHTRLRSSWKLETTLGKNMTKRRRVFGRAAEFTVFVRSLHRNHPRMGRTVSDSAGSSSDWIRPGSRGAA